MVIYRLSKLKNKDKEIINYNRNLKTTHVDNRVQTNKGRHLNIMTTHLAKRILMDIVIMNKWKISITKTKRYFTNLIRRRK